METVVIVFCWLASMSLCAMSGWFLSKWAYNRYTVHFELRDIDDPTMHEESASGSVDELGQEIVDAIIDGKHVNADTTGLCVWSEDVYADVASRALDFIEANPEKFYHELPAFANYCVEQYDMAHNEMGMLIEDPSAGDVELDGTLDSFEAELVKSAQYMKNAEVESPLENDIKIKNDFTGNTNGGSLDIAAMVNGQKPMMSDEELAKYGLKQVTLPPLPAPYEDVPTQAVLPAFDVELTGTVSYGALPKVDLDYITERAKEQHSIYKGLYKGDDLVKYLCGVPPELLEDKERPSVEEAIRVGFLPRGWRYSLIRHKKTGGLYDFLCWAINSTNGSGEYMGLYQARTEGAPVYCRLASEMLDGRFEQVVHDVSKHGCSGPCDGRDPSCVCNKPKVDFDAAELVNEIEAKGGIKVTKEDPRQKLWDEAKKWAENPNTMPEWLQTELAKGIPEAGQTGELRREVKLTLGMAQDDGGGPSEADLYLPVGTPLEVFGDQMEGRVEKNINKVMLDALAPMLVKIYLGTAGCGPYILRFVCRYDILLDGLGAHTPGCDLQTLADRLKTKASS